MEDENDSPERDETEAAEEQSAEESEAQAEADEDFVPSSYQAIWEASAGYRAMADEVARTQEYLRRATEPLQHAIAESLRVQQMMRNSMPDLSFIVPQINWGALHSLADAAAGARRAIERVSPTNWLQESLDYTAMLPLLEEGTPLAWVPSAPVIRELLAAPDAQARSGVLEANTEQIVAACRESLDAVSTRDLGQQVGLLEDCLAMVEAGPSSGAQALAASVWDTVYRAVWRAEPSLKTSRIFKYKDVAKKHPKIDLDDSTFLQFRQACVFAPFAKASDEFYDSHPVPGAFNRHATAHAAGATQYSRANALTALMLAVSLVRELEQGNLSFAMRG